jgi:ABC-type transporter Mla subunit MlaD
MPWEISVGLAGASLLVFAALAAVTLAEIRRTGKNAAELAATLDRHVPVIRQNLDEIGRNANALGASLRALSERASETGRGFENAAAGIGDLERDVQENLVAPLQRIAGGVSALIAFGAALRRFRHPFRRGRRKGRA